MLFLCFFFFLFSFIPPQAMFACSKVKACGFLYDYRKPKNGHCVTYIYRNSVIKGEQWEDLAREDQ